jgi:uncharacterized OB-fold protein
MIKLETQSAGSRGPERVFEEFLHAGHFMLQRNQFTGQFVFYPRYVIVGSEPEDLQWVEASGRGIVYATTVVRTRSENISDYGIVIVELAEGPRLMSTVIGIAPEDVYIGMEVMARIDSNAEPIRLVFHAVQSGANTR